ISPYINEIYYIDDLLSGRIRIVSLFYDELTFHSFLMGSRIPDKPLDNAYIMLLMNGGVASVLFFLITFIKGVRKLPNEYTGEYFPFVTAVLLSGCGESTFSALTAYSLVFYRILYENFFLKYNVQTSCSYLSARQ
ncbi:MAG: hypothetical protein IKO56_01725, partial [Alphaproteobacteria bacterium]|nr:hypothetical protein [Alphaproteobacteria bacterium]